MKTLTLDLTERERRDLIAMVHAYDTGFPVADRMGDFVLNQRSKDVSRRFHEIAKRITGALTERDTITCRDDMVHLKPGSVYPAHVLNEKPLDGRCKHCHTVIDPWQAEVYDARPRPHDQLSGHQHAWASLRAR